MPTPADRKVTLPRGPSSFPKAGSENRQKSSKKTVHMRLRATSPRHSKGAHCVCDCRDRRVAPHVLARDQSGNFFHFPGARGAPLLESPRGGEVLQGAGVAHRMCNLLAQPPQVQDFQCSGKKVPSRTNPSVCVVACCYTLSAGLKSTIPRKASVVNLRSAPYIQE